MMKKVKFKCFKQELGYSIMGNDHALVITPIKGEINLKDMLSDEQTWLIPNYEDGSWKLADLSCIGEITIVTHNGIFHADEVLGVISLKKKLDKYNIKSKLIRTRDPKVIESSDIAIDVGGIYDPDNLRFDHHQDPKLECSYYLLRNNKIGEYIFYVDKKKIDEGDRGIEDHSSYPLIRFIKSQNSLNLEENDKKFFETIEILEDIMKKCKTISSMEKKLNELADKNNKKIEKKKKNFLNSIKGLQPDSDGIIVFDKDDEFLPFWKQELNGLTKPELKWIVFWDKLKKLLDYPSGSNRSK
jgi:uncharacterized UPF0160 family protein